EDRRNDQDHQERRQEDPDRRGEGAPETVEERSGESGADQKAHERRRDYDRPGADHAHRHGDEELALVQPSRLLHEALLEEGHDDETAAERERARLEEKREEFAQQRAKRRRRRA